MNQAELQRLAQTRVEDAEALLDKGRWSAAYYLIGYAVECALKSCVLRYLHTTGVIFRDRDYLKKLGDCWTHDLERLVTLAGLDPAFGAARGANPALAAYWAVVKDWEETSRYEDRTEADARKLFEAVTHDPDGVLKWVRLNW